MRAIRKTLAIISVEAIKEQTTATETWKVCNKLARMTKERRSQGYKTRNTHALQPPMETPTAKKSLWPKLFLCWNKLPPNIKECDDKIRAKKLIKNWIRPPQKPPDPISLARPDQQQSKVIRTNKSLV